MPILHSKGNMKYHKLEILTIKVDILKVMLCHASSSERVG